MSAAPVSFVLPAPLDTVTPATPVLLVDDDAGIRDVVSAFLHKHGLQVDTACDAVQMRARLAEKAYALVVLDLMMPGEDGLTALRGLQRSGGPPVIMLSAVGSDVDRIVGLEVGAEDYLAKPCNPRELLARIRTVLRRSSAPAGAALPGAAAGSAAPPPAPPPPRPAIADAVELEFAGWRIDLMARLLVNPDGADLLLSDGEFRLLRAFLQHPRRVLSRDQLLDYAMTSDSIVFDRAIDVQVSRLRRKLAHGDARAELIRTVRNEGYMFLPAVTPLR